MLTIGISSKYRISDSCIDDGLQSRDDISDLPFVEDTCGRVLWSETSILEGFDLGSCIDEFELISLGNRS
jgi:hypothetical protein